MEMSWIFISRTWIGIEGNSRKLNLSLSVKILVLLVLLDQSAWLTLWKKEAILCSNTTEMPHYSPAAMIYSIPGILLHLFLLHSLGIFLREEDWTDQGYNSRLPSCLLCLHLINHWCLHSALKNSKSTIQVLNLICLLARRVTLKSGLA